MRELIVLSLIACGHTDSSGGGHGDTDSSTSPGDADVDTDADADGDADTDTTGTTGGNGDTADTSCAGVKGILVDPDGNPLAATQVLCCQTVTCLTQDSGPDGSFSFCSDPETDYAVKSHESVSPKWAAALEPAHVAYHMVDIGTLYTPSLPGGAIVEDESHDPQTLDVGDGLRLTVNDADLKAPFGVFLTDIAARLVPSEYVPTYEDVGGETVVGVWALHPFGLTSTSPIPVRIPSTLAAGTPVNFWVVDELNGDFTVPIPGTADGTYASTNAGEGIEKLTYLVVTTP